MFFTQDDYKKIQQWLTKNSVKDTEFNEANIPFNGEETITIVQGNQNKKVFLKDLIAQVFNLGISDFVNITDKYDAPNISLEEAIRLIPSRARKEGQVITFLDMEDHWHIYQFKGVLNQWNVLDTWEDLFDWEKLIIDSILPDEEDLTKSLPDTNGNSYLSLKDRAYNPEDFSGLGRVILRKNIVEVEDPIYGKVKNNILYQDMFTQSNTIYEIRYDFDLNGQEITIPEGCVLDFQGGSLNNGKLILNNTYISGLIKFNAVQAAGSIKNKEIYSSYILGNNRAILLSGWSSLGALLIIDTKEVLNETLNLNGDIKCLYDIEFEAENIDKAVYINKEFDVNNLSIDCKKVNNCHYGVYIDKQYNTTRKSYYNINVKNIKNNSYLDLSATGCVFVQTSTSSFNPFNIDIKGRIENIHSKNDGIVGNPSGGCAGLKISINNNQQGQIIDIHDMYVYNVIEAEKIVEDSDGISILANDGSDGLLNKVSIHNCTIKYCGRRNIKAQIPGLHIYDCLLDLDYTNGNDNICSQIAIGVQAKNIQIQNCRIIRKSVSGFYGIHINNSANCSIDNVYLEMNGYNHIHATGNCANLNINAVAYSSPEYGEENAVPERAVCILEGGNITGTINLKIDAQKYSAIGLHNCNGSDNLFMTTSGTSYRGINISYSSNFIISNCKLKTLAASITVPTNVSNIEIINNNFYCSNCFSATVENTNNIKFINNIVESFDESLTYPIIVFGRCKNIIIKNNCIKNVSNNTYAINCFQVDDVTILDNKIQSDYNCVTIAGTKISMINNLFSGNFTSYVETQYGMGSENYYFYNNKTLNSEKVIEGQMKYNHSAHKNMVWNGNKWEYVTTSDNLKTNGNFSDKPSNPPIGFQYLCQDRQTIEGAIGGIVIYYKGNNIWVDALGRVVE